MTDVEDGRGPGDGAARGWADVHARLEARLRAVEAEIRAYPKPIPACDAQYEHLLLQRRAIPRDMERARALAHEVAPVSAPAAIARFVAECAWLGDAPEPAFAGDPPSLGR